MFQKPADLKQKRWAIENIQKQLGSGLGWTIFETCVTCWMISLQTHWKSKCFDHLPPSLGWCVKSRCGLCLLTLHCWSMFRDEKLLVRGAPTAIGPVIGPTKSLSSATSVCPALSPRHGANGCSCDVLFCCPHILSTAGHGTSSKSGSETLKMMSACFNTSTADSATCTPPCLRH